jgi:hypothetical protein
MIEFNEKTNPYNKTIRCSIIHFLKYLIPKYNNYCITVEYFKPDKFDSKSSMWSKGELIENSNRDYTIRLNSSLNIVAMVKTVAHECVHIKQWIKQKPCEWSFDRKPRNSFEKYMLDPNELEACALTDFLFADLIHKNKNLNKKLYIDYDFYEYK